VDVEVIVQYRDAVSENFERWASQLGIEKRGTWVQQCRRATTVILAGNLRKGNADIQVGAAQAAPSPVRLFNQQLVERVVWLLQVFNDPSRLPAATGPLELRLVRMTVPRSHRLRCLRLGLLEAQDLLGRHADTLCQRKDLPLDVRDLVLLACLNLLGHFRLKLTQLGHREIA